MEMTLTKIAALVLCACGLLPHTSPARAQHGQNAPTYPAKLPYRFSNFVWWTDDELRVALRRRLPGLGDEVATNSSAEGQIRDALTTLLKERGVTAEVQSEEPGPLQLSPMVAKMYGKPVPDSPKPAILFLILTPKVVVAKVDVSPKTDLTGGELLAQAKGWEGKSYGTMGINFAARQMEELLGQRGYIEAHVEARSGRPRRTESGYAVDLEFSITAGRQFHVSTISANPGPLREARNLAHFFTLQPGDLATESPFKALDGQLLSLYHHAGYADVMIDDGAALDRESATVAYHLRVEPGEQYRFRKLVVKHLDAELARRVTSLFAIKAGEIYDESAINQLYQDVRKEPAFAGRSFSYSPQRDEATRSIDLTVDFFVESDDSSVTVH